MPKPDPKSGQRMIAIEPATMSVPTMDRPSIALAWFMDNIVVESDVYEERYQPAWRCALCDAVIMYIDDGDDLRTVFNTALAHGCDT